MCKAPATVLPAPAFTHAAAALPASAPHPRRALASNLPQAAQPHSAPPLTPASALPQLQPPPGSFNFNYLKSGGFIFLAVADEAFGRQVGCRRLRRHGARPRPPSGAWAPAGTALKPRQLRLWWRNGCRRRGAAPYR